MHIILGWWAKDLVGPVLTGKIPDISGCGFAFLYTVLPKWLPINLHNALSQLQYPIQYCFWAGTHFTAKEARQWLNKMVGWSFKDTVAMPIR